MRTPLASRARAWALIMAALPGLLLAGESDLYDWLGTAPVVLAGENLGTYGKYAEFRVDRTLRGAPPAGEVVRVAVRRANRDRDREIDREPVRFDAGRSYLLLLDPDPQRATAAKPAYELIRGPRGAREIPLEGGAPLIEAARRFVELQDRNDDVAKWRQFSAMLEETDPLILATALAQFLKFRRGDEALIPTVRPLVDHPETELRLHAARLIAQILDGPAEVEPLPDAPSLLAQLVARARTDAAVAVRVAATEALERLDAPEVPGLLATIAREDPAQDVRYAAERLLHERTLRQDESVARPD